MLVLRKGQFEEIVHHARKALPNEACGLLAGQLADDKRVVEKVYLLTNVDNSPVHFSMDPKEQFHAIKDIRSNGWVLLGNFHSHPESPSRPSDEDKRLAFDPVASYLILSLMHQDHPVLKSFRIQDREVSEEKIVFA
ncbi:M67 family metallopeptidase [Candidatus Formimonas warabiya]|uniref:MPN domain-containing protein n=1 Tax=Formimonas warabiya TaxID=1761012 RepID=A0A3G1L0A6_FORW1|nr:M67 family metallopeptidase [Candidatus Formimonas warabiya]ATW28074.1 hypothetical protein DCMF_27945 [Candidatus Formimonas warabiya]